MYRRIFTRLDLMTRYYRINRETLIKMSKAVMLVMLVQIFVSCNITYKVRNTDNELEEVLHMPCGELGLEIIGKGNSKFRLRHRFLTREQIFLNPDSLHIFCNSEQIDYKYPRLNKGNKPYILEGEEKYDVQFEIATGVFDGDTIALVGPRYIKCRQDFVNLDTVYYTFINRLRIHGVNAL